MESITDFINGKIKARKEEQRKTKAQEQKERLRKKKQEYLAYRNSPEFKEGIMDELVMQTRIHREFPNDPDYSKTASFNYIYLFDNNCNLLGKEQQAKTKKEKK